MHTYILIHTYYRSQSILLTNDKYNYSLLQLTSVSISMSAPFNSKNLTISNDPLTHAIKNAD